MKNKKNRWIKNFVSKDFKLILLLIPFCVLLTACGKKGPPVPPIKETKILNPPIDLRYTIDEDIFFLSWNHLSDKKNTKLIKPEKFEVFMFYKALSSCEKCPLNFKSIGIVSMPSMEFNTKIQRNYKYYFKVRAIGKKNIKSKYSKTIELEHK